MASQQESGQPQLGRDEIQMKKDFGNQQQPDYHRQMDQLSNSTQSNSLLQQTGEQVKSMAQGAADAATGAARGAVNVTQGAAAGAANMAQGAADAMKKTLGINNPSADNNPNPNPNAIPPTSSANHPSNPHPANPNTKI